MFKRLKQVLNKGYKQGHTFYSKGKEIIGKNLWLELLTLVALTLIASIIVFFMVSRIIYGIGWGKHTFNYYEESRIRIQADMLEMVDAINRAVEKQNNSITQDKQIEEITEIEATTDLEIKEKELWLEKQIQRIVYTDLNREYLENSNTYLIDSLGKVMFYDGTVESFNLHKIIKRINNEDTQGVSNKFKGIYPVIINDEVCYLYNESTLEPIEKVQYSSIGNIMGLMAGVGFFTLVMFYLTRNKIEYIEYLSACLGEISKGNLEYKIEIMGDDELAKVAESIMHMENELKAQIEAQAKIEKSKNELVTNVAHDLRTPLTSIIGYIGLMKMSNCNEEDRKKYLDIVSQKSEKLKVMIEDLFQLTKLHQGQIALQKTEISISNLINQLIEELLPLASDKNIQIEPHIQLQDTTCVVDVSKVTRVFENLIENAIKYTHPNETIYIELCSKNNKIYIAVSNPTEPIAQEELNQFFERFYRADASRNSAGGSGLGLAIAKSIVQLHSGTIKAKYVKDLLCFLVVLPRK